MRVAKVLSTSITAAALVFSMLASAIPAAAESGFHAAYFSESSFLGLAPGQTGQFAVGYSNTGDIAWVKGSATAQISLYTRNGDATLFNAGWASGWVSSTIYAHQANDLVAPGQVGFFIYNIQVPANAPQGEQRFTGYEVVNGVVLEDYGYYQIVTVTGSALTITGSNPASPSTNPTPIISGTGATATTTVSIMEGSTTLCTATASSTGAFSCTVSTLAAGSHSLTASAPGQGTSAVFTYVVDTASPTVSTVTTPNLRSVMVCYNKAMSTSGGNSIVDQDASNTGAASRHYLLNSVAMSLTAASANTDKTCATLQFLTPLTNNTAYTLTVQNVADAAGNMISPNPTTVTFTASDATFPTATSVAQPGTYTLTVNFSEPVFGTITGGALTAANFKWDSANFPGIGSSNTIFSPGTRIDLYFCTAAGAAPSSGGWTAATAGILFGAPCAAAAVPAVGTHALDVSVYDAAGNLITPNPTTFTVTIVGTNDTTRPTVTSVSDLRSQGSELVSVNFSESMKFSNASGTSNAVDSLANYNLTNPDGSQATTSCSSTGGTALTNASAADLTAGGWSFSNSLASAARQDVKTIRLVNSTNYLQSGCAYILTIQNVQDQAGNALNPNPTNMTVTSTADTTLPVVTGAKSSNTRLVVTYSKDMKPGTNTSTGACNNTSGQYTGSGALATSLAGATIVCASDGTSAIITYSTSLTAGSYTLTVTNVADAWGNVITPNPTTLTISFSDTSTPTFNSASLISSGTSTIIRAVYSEAMAGGATPSNSAGNPGNYSINNGSYGAICAAGSATITSNPDGTQWDLSCSSNVFAGAIGQPGANTLTVKNVADLQGNVISPNPSTRSF